MVNGPGLVKGAQDALTAKRVFGEPYEKDGVTFIPAATVLGGGGAGTGEGEGSKGSGGGFGLVAKPAGAFVIKEGNVRWIGAVDVNRAILGGQIVAIVALLTLRSLIKAAAKRRRTRGLPDAQESHEDGGRMARVLEMAHLRAK